MVKTLYLKEQLSHTSSLLLPPHDPFIILFIFYLKRALCERAIFF